MGNNDRAMKQDLDRNGGVPVDPFRGDLADEIDVFALEIRHARRGERSHGGLYLFKYFRLFSV